MCKMSCKTAHYFWRPAKSDFFKCNLYSKSGDVFSLIWNIVECMNSLKIIHGMECITVSKSETTEIEGSTYALTKEIVSS